MKRVKYCVNSPPAPSRYKATTQTSYGISYITVGYSSQPQYMHACMHLLHHDRCSVNEETCDDRVPLAFLTFCPIHIHEISCTHREAWIRVIVYYIWMVIEWTLGENLC